MSAAWTWAEEKELESALLLIPDGTDRRWEKIAERLPGRSAQEVEEHYKEISNRSRVEAPPPVAVPARREWSRSENMEFENALLVFPEGSDGRWEKIAERLPGRTAQEVEQHYLDLLHDVELIDNVLEPEYHNVDTVEDALPLDAAAADDESTDEDEDEDEGGLRPLKRQKPAAADDE